MAARSLPKPGAISGSLDRPADRVGVGGVVIRHAVPDHGDALRSHEPLAEVVGIDPRNRAISGASVVGRQRRYGG